MWVQDGEITIGQPVQATPGNWVKKRSGSDEEQDAMVSTYTIYPNPSDGKTLHVGLSSNLEKNVTLEVYNLLGVKVSVLFEDFASKYNTYTVEFKGEELPAGVYFYKLTTGEWVFYNKLILYR